MAKLSGSLSLVIVVALAATAAAQDCVDYALQVRVVGREQAPAAPLWDLATAGSYVYGAGREGTGLEIIDISEPTAPRVVGVSGVPVWPDLAWGVAVDGDAACVAGDTALYVFDVTDRSAPILQGTAPLGVLARSVETGGGMAFVVAGFDSLLVYDVADPTAPVRVGALGGISVADAGLGDTSALADGLLFIAGRDGMTVVDVAAPAAPMVLGGLPTADEVFGLAVAGDLLYLVTLPYATLHVVDISSPAVPRTIATLALPLGGMTVAATVDRVFVGGCCGVEVVDVSEPSAPVYLGNAYVSADIYGMAVQGGLLYLATTGGLRVCDITYPTGLMTTGGVAMPSRARQLAAAADLLFVADHTGGLRILDTASAGGPVELGVYTGTVLASGVDVQDSLAYVVDILQGLDVVDVSDPAAPVRIGRLGLADRAEAVTVVGDRAYLATAWTNLAIVDVSQPTAPVFLGALDDTLRGVAVAVGGDYAFVGGPDAGLQVVDVSDPGAPAVVASLFLGAGVDDIALVGDVVYAADYMGLYVVDVADPGAPVVRAVRRVEGIGRGVAVVGDRVYLATTGGVSVFDVADPADPIALGELRTSSAALDVHVADRIFAATYYDGVVWAPVQCADSIVGTVGGGDDDPGDAVPRLPLDLDVRPNPFNPRVEIRFLLDRAETVRATVHDLRGRRVRTLAAGPLAVGPHLLVWDGRDDAGKVTESGVYIVRLESARGVTSRKVTLLR